MRPRLLRSRHALLPEGTQASGYLAHRHERLEQVRSALRDLGEDASARQIVEHVYVDVDEKLWDAAEWSVEVQLQYLRTH